MNSDPHDETPETIKAERDRLLEIVMALGTVSSSPATAQGLMDDTVRQVMQLTRADGAVVELLDGDELEYRAASGTVAGHLGSERIAVVAVAATLSRHSFVDNDHAARLVPRRTTDLRRHPCEPLY